LVFAFNHLKHAWPPRLAICGERPKSGAERLITLEGWLRCSAIPPVDTPLCFVLAYVQAGQIKTHIATLGHTSTQQYPKDSKAPMHPTARLFGD